LESALFVAGLAQQTLASGYIRCIFDDFGAKAINKLVYLLKNASSRAKAASGGVRSNETADNDQSRHARLQEFT